MDEVQLAQLQSAVRALHTHLQRTMPPVDGVSRTAARVLGAVARAQDDDVQPRRVADELSMTSSNVAAALRELEEAGYIERHRDHHDGRRVSVALTPRGADAVAAHRALRIEGLRATLDAALTPAEQRQLAAAVPLLDRMAEAGGG